MNIVLLVGLYRVLKSNILSPLTDLNTIETRLDLVEYLAHANADDLDAVGDALTAFIDLDKVLDCRASLPVRATRSRQ